MTSTAVVTRAAAIALGALLTLHQPASAGATLETSNSGASSWTYTAGATGRTYNFAPIQGTDWLGGTQDATAVAAIPSGSLAVAAAVPEPGTLALLGFPLLFVAALVRRRRR